MRLVVRARDMGHQGAEFPPRALEHEWNMIGLDLSVSEGHPATQWMGIDQRVQYRRISLGKLSGNVHVGLGKRAGRCQY